MTIVLQQLQRQLRTQCLLRFTSPSILRSQQPIHTTTKLDTFWERSKKAGYEKVHNISKKQQILDGLKELKKEINLWRQEVEESIKNDPILIWRPGETDVVFPFATQEDIDKFVVTADSDHNEGFSKATFEVSSAGHGLFHGQLDAKLAKDGKIKKTGYANIKSMRPRVRMGARRTGLS
jgi:NADH dehydrogenase [ubiquinone] 1 alpha subcomplex assembly factor 1